MDVKKIEQVKEMVKKECHENSQSFQWEYHFLIVHRYAMELAEKYTVNREILEYGVWLHDITRIRELDPEHNVTGAKKAEEILKGLGYSKEIIEEVKHCILTHRGNGSEEAKTMEARILRAADAMSHFAIVPLLMYYGSKIMGFEESVRWLVEKIERDWHKKLDLPEAREMVTEKYKAFRALFGEWMEVDVKL